MRGKTIKIERVFEQGSGLLNEDCLTCQDNLFGVFDGASSLVPNLFQGKTGAWWAYRMIRSEFAKNDASLFELGSRANKQLQLQMTAMQVESNDHLHCWSTSAAVCRLKDNHVEWLQSGDCQILAISQNDECRLLTDYHNHDQETLQLWQRLIANNEPEPRKKLRPQIEKVRGQMNRSYGTFNGNPAALDFCHLGSHPLSDIRHLLIFTDGLLPPSEHPDEKPDFCWLARHFHQGGLQQVMQEIRRLEKSDPHCHRFPRFKQHDDIAAIAVSLTD